MKPKIISAVPRDQSMPITLDDLYSMASGYMNQRWQTDHEIPPLWFCVAKEAIVVVFTPWESEADKNLAVGFLRSMIKTLDVECYAFMTEAWVATVTPNTPDDLAKQMPMDRPDRKEVVMLSAFEKSGGNSRSTFFDIMRKAGREAFLVETKVMQGVGSFEGRMFDLFKKARTVN